MKPRSRREPFDRGETLIEALVTISILGIAVVSLLGALLIAVKTSTLHRKEAQSQSALRSWAEKVSADLYDACASPAQFAGPGALPVGLTGAIASVQYWDGSAFGSACNAATDTGLQRVTLRITVAPGIYPGFTDDLNVVVRKPCASAC